MRFDIRDWLARLGPPAVLLTLLLLTSAPRLWAQEPATPDDPRFGRNVGVLRTGDELKIVVFRDAELSGSYLIDSRGDVQIPGLGVLRAAGLDPAQVKERIRQALIDRGFANPEVAVQPLVRVAVLGEVRNPALYSVDPGTSLIALLTLAGGPTENANLRKARVVREGKPFEVDLQSALSGSASGRVVLNSNDVVVVPKKTGLTRERIAFAMSGLGVLLSLANVIITLQR